MTAFIGDTIVRHEDGSHSVLSAKDAAELARLRQERHETNEALSDAAVQLRVQRDRIAAYEALELGTPEGRISAKCADASHPVWLRDLDDTRSCPWCRIAELEALTPAPIQTCQTCGAGYDLGQPCSTCRFQALIAEATADEDPAADDVIDVPDSWRPPRQPEDPHDGIPTFSAHEIARWQARQQSAAIPAQQAEDPHDGPNHHDYALSRDLPTIPRQTTGRCTKGHTFEDCTCGGTA
jgi:hypothetical protein